MKFFLESLLLPAYLIPSLTPVFVEAERTISFRQEEELYRYVYSFYLFFSSLLLSFLISSLFRLRCCFPSLPGFMSSLGPFTLVPPSHFTASVGLFLDQLSFAAFPVAPYCGDHFTFSFFFSLYLPFPVNRMLFSCIWTSPMRTSKWKWGDLDRVGQISDMGNGSERD